MRHAFAEESVLLLTRRGPAGDKPDEGGQESGSPEDLAPGEPGFYNIGLGLDVCGITYVCGACDM